jgi:hypothetical protein
MAQAGCPEVFVIIISPSSHMLSQKIISSSSHMLAQKIKSNHESLLSPNGLFTLIIPSNVTQPIQLNVAK